MQSSSLSRMGIVSKVFFCLFLTTAVPVLADSYCVIPFSIFVFQADCFLNNLSMTWFLTPLILCYHFLHISEYQNPVKVWCLELTLYSGYVLLSFRIKGLKCSMIWELYFFDLNTKLLITEAKNHIILFSICNLLLIHM